MQQSEDNTVLRNFNAYEYVLHRDFESVNCTG